MIRDVFRVCGLLSALWLSAGCAPGEGGGVKASASSGKCGVSTDSCQRSKPSFADARAVVGKRCTSCHSPDGEAGAEHDFTSDATVQSHKANILAQLSACSMPPPGAPKLSDEERAAIECWASAQ